jgi:hypothetical protein
LRRDGITTGTDTYSACHREDSCLERERILPHRADLMPAVPENAVFILRAL